MSSHAFVLLNAAIRSTQHAPVKPELRLTLGPHDLVLIITAKDDAGASQRSDSNQGPHNDRSSSAQALHARNERGRRTKTTKHQCNGGNGDISSVHKTTSSKRKTLFLMN